VRGRSAGELREAAPREANGMVVAEALLRSRGMIPDDEVWVHGMWTPRVWRECWQALKSRKKLVRMTHGSLSPIYLERQSKWKKRLVAPIERYFFARSARVVVTGEWEAEWCREWGIKGPFQTVDLKAMFDFPPSFESQWRRATGRHLRLLCLSRIHPLKGIDILREAVQGLPVELRVESELFDEAKEAAFAWCDCLVLPTLSENFGLVVAEALMRGKPAITTDGAQAWADQPGVRYVKGYCGAERTRQVELLRTAIAEQISADGGCP